MIRSKLFEYEDHLGVFMKDNPCITIISVETILQKVHSKPLGPRFPSISIDQEFIKLWYREPEHRTSPIPSDAHSLEVFAIKDTPEGKEAYIGYKLPNQDFYFIQVPFKTQ